MSADVIGLIITVVGLIIAFVSGIVIPLILDRLQQRRTQKHPKLTPIKLDKHQPADFSFPELVQVRNRGSATATDILGVIFPAGQFANQHPRGAKYTPHESAVQGQHEIEIYHAQSDDTDIPDYWMIGEHTLRPNPQAGVMSRLMLTYEDDDGHSFASAFDHLEDGEWDPIAHLTGIKLNIKALETEYQRRIKFNLPLWPPPPNGIDISKRRFIVVSRRIGISTGLVVLGGGIGIPIGSLLFSKTKIVGPGPTPPTPTPTPTPTPALLYQADWSSGLNGWVGGSDWSTNNGMLVNNGTNTDISGRSLFSIVAPFQPKTANYVVEVQIQFLGQFSSSTDYLFGIMLRGGTATGYLCFIFDRNQARIRTAYGSIIQYALQLPIDMSWHTYRAVVNNNLISFFMDKTLVGEILDNTYMAPGVVGLIDINSQINVRSFTISPASS